jgi:hypothetical protein
MDARTAAASPAIPPDGYIALTSELPGGNNRG